MTQRKIKSLLAEIFFIFVCLFGFGYSIFQLWLNLNKSHTKSEENIAVLTFKYKTAQRKTEDDPLWDYIQQDSPIYDGDIIRTSPLSEATISFNDGSQINLYENTLVKVCKTADGSEVQLDNGQLEVQTGNSNGMKVKSGTSLVNIDKKASVSAGLETSSASGKKELNVQVQNGTAALTDTVTGSVKMKLNAGQTAAMDSAGNVQKKRLSVSYPLKDAKILVFDDSNGKVTFRWDCDGENGVTLEFFASKTKDTPVQSFIVNGEYSQEVELAPGIYWWRLTSGDEAAEGKINICQSLSPQLIAPAADYVAGFRTKKPDVRFVWSESEGATAYELVIADNERLNKPVVVQRTTQTSSIISSLAEGTWYWRVTPFYTINNTGLANGSEVSSFKITKNAEFKKPELQIPEENGLVSTKITVKAQTIYKNVTFSWKNNPEAVSYEYKLWKNSSSGQPYTSGTVTDNYFTIDTSKLELPNGTWYWQVTALDSEGKQSASEIRKFNATDSTADQRTLFPPDGYRLSASRSMDIRYSWKTNLPYPTTFQLATDKEFKNLIHSETTTSKSAGGRDLVPGTYYWRITTKIADTELSTPVKTLNVVLPLEAPVAKTPLDGTREVIREGVPLKFIWNAVENADYYQIKLYTADNLKTSVYEHNYITPNEKGEIVEALDLWSFNETDYVWTIQAFAEEKSYASRESGRLSSYKFKLKKLKPVKLLLPINGTEFGGIEAVKSPANFVWTSVDQPSKSQLIIYKDGSTETYKFKIIEKPKYTNKMPQLYEGQYYWKIVAQTYDNLDISSREMNTFTVKKMPVLPSTRLLRPAANTEINIDYIIENGLQVYFEWQKLNQEVARYILRIYNIHDPSPVFEIDLGSETTSYLFDGDDFSNTLGKANGGWYWTVEAQTDFMGMLLQRGKEARLDFTVNVPRNKPSDVKTEDERYNIRFGVEQDFEVESESIKKKLSNAKKGSEKIKLTDKKQKKKKKKKK